VRKFNIFAPEFDHSSERETYRWRGARVGHAVGADEIGACLYELPDGERTYPYHLHHGNEEWLLVVAGAPTLRTPEGERVLREGDLVCFPAGPAGAHCVTGPGTVLLLSSKNLPDVVEYPDSGKVGVRHQHPGGGQNFLAADAVGYWEGE
jgi:uncharacterized cupin superfamily protein